MAEGKTIELAARPLNRVDPETAAKLASVGIGRGDAWLEGVSKLVDAPVSYGDEVAVAAMVAVMAGLYLESDAGDGFPAPICLFRPAYAADVCLDTEKDGEGLTIGQRLRATHTLIEDAEHLDYDDGSDMVVAARYPESRRAVGAFALRRSLVFDAGCFYYNVTLAEAVNHGGSSSEAALLIALHAQIADDVWELFYSAALSGIGKAVRLGFHLDRVSDTRLAERFRAEFDAAVDLARGRAEDDGLEMPPGVRTMAKEAADEFLGRPAAETSTDGDPVQPDEPALVVFG